MAQSEKMKELLRALPSVQRLLDVAAVQTAREGLGHDAVAAAARDVLSDLRERILEGDGAGDHSPEMLAQRTIRRAENRSRGSMRRVINATGVILHTGLGRAVLPEAALKGIADELQGYASVELDLESGKRGQREAASEDLLKTILGCEAATVVNNNAAATMLSLSALARRREVIVSRGQLVEIGGSFRMPDVMSESGAVMVEVGTTNRTKLKDYENAITERSAVLILVHTSNYRIQGFTAEVEIEALVGLGRKHGLTVVHDIGSGALFPDMAVELSDEPIVKHSLDVGADVVTFSGDKILGGPQAGICVGRRETVEKLRKHPLYRAFRCDKLILRALESTLALYLDGERRVETVPSLRMLRMPLDVIKKEARKLVRGIKAACTDMNLEIDTAGDTSRLGSGSLPEGNIPTEVVRIRHPKASADKLAGDLRSHAVPVVVRIQDGRILIDPRTLQKGEADEIIQAFSQLK